MVVQDFISILEKEAPLSYQESYDNAGLLVGNKPDSVSKVLITLDVTEAVVQEAIECGANLIISHHPMIFKPLRKINNDTDGRAAIVAAGNAVIERMISEKKLMNNKY